MAITIQQYAEALLLAVQEANPKDHDRVLDNFVNILHANADLGKYEQIVAEFEKMDLASQGVKKAELTLARDAEVSEQILNELNDIAGAKLKLEKKVDESIIGGMVLRVDDTLIDASVKGQLDRLQGKLSE